MTREEISRHVQDELEGYPEIQLAILYGSVARNTHRRDSDVDLAVAADSRVPLPVERLLHLSLACSHRVGREVQVRDLARAEGLFLKQILTTSNVLVSRNSTVYGELIVRMLAFVADMLPGERNTSVIDRDVLDAKVESLRRCLERIRTHTPENAENLLTDYDAQDIIALNLQRAVQLCVDMGSHIIGGNQWNAPETMAGVFPILEENGTIAADLSARMQRAVGFRNIAVHEYQAVDWHRVYRMVTENLDDFRAFTRAVLAAYPP